MTKIPNPKLFGIVILLFVIVLFSLLYLTPVFRGDTEVKSGFQLGPLNVRYYGLLLAGAVLLCWYLADRIASRFAVSKDFLERSLFWAIMSGFLGARLLVVLQNWSFFRAQPAEIFKIWHGGLAIYGAIVGASLAVYLLAKKSNQDVWRVLDILAVVVPLGQAIGRFGNFFNQEAFGPPTDLSWKMFIDPHHRPAGYLGFQFFHPTFLYEAVWNFAIFMLLLYLTKKNLKPGTYLGLYMMFYGSGRFFIEYLRLDSFFVGNFRLNQLISLATIGIAILILVVSHRYAKES